MIDKRPVSPLNMEVFAGTRLWNPLPPPKTIETAVETPPPRRPNLRLIAIIEENGSRIAALQDLDRQEMLLLSVGERIEPYAVAAITGDEVRLEDGWHVSLLRVHREREQR